MAVCKIFYRFIESPTGDTTVKSIEAPEGSFTFTHLLEPIEKGNYKIEYWALDDSGKESDKKVSDLRVGDNAKPLSYKGGVFVPENIESETQEVFFRNCNVTLSFKRGVDGLGVFFDWTTLNLRTVVIEQDRLEIPTNSWLYGMLVKKNGSFDVSFYSSKNKKLFVKKDGSEFLALLPNGNLNPLLAGVIRNVVRNGRQVSFTVLKPANFIMK